jgi:DNA repair exonuclease SbcCD ATPase subunit
MGNEQTKTKATKVRRLKDVTMVASFHRYNWWTLEQQAQQADDRAKEFNDFIRDHRSQDDIQLEVVREYRDECSVCGEEWEPAEDDKTHDRYCASCGAEVQ